MKQSYIDYIEKTVREHCKELQWLSIGCRILFRWFPCLVLSEHTDQFFWADRLINFMWFPNNDKVTYNYRYEKSDLIEILWHEIQPHHILRTMGENISIDGVWKIWKLDRWTKGMEQARWYNNTELFFDLSLSWKDQSEETLKFIATVMGFNQ